MILALATGMVVNVFGQAVEGTIPTGSPVTTSPAGLSLLEVQSRLITQNSVTGATGTQVTGSFTANARWNSMGNLSAGSQTLNGFRTQTDGRALATGFTVPSGGSVSNPFIQWGGNNSLSPVVDPGDLEFRSFTDPTSASSDLRFSIRGFDGTALFGASPSTFFTSPTLEISNSGATTSDIALGVYTGQNNATGNYGIKSICETVNFSSFGVYGEALGSATNYGIYGVANSTGATNYGGYFVGNVLTTGSYLTISDRKFKTNINKEIFVLAKVKQLNPVNYQFKNDENYKNYGFAKEFQHGFIADELEKVFPELITKAKHPVFENKKIIKEDSYNSVNYIALIPILTKAIQELHAKVEVLENQLAQKTTEPLVVYETNNTVEAKELIKKAYLLAQNVPNPFTSSTTIKYSIPANNVAMIAVFDLNGKMLLQFPELRGSAQITINGSTLQAGMYLYSLLVNGQEIITKKMILTK